MKTRKNTVINYYDTCENDYRLLWDLDHSHAMHAGYWDNTTKNLRDALRRENEVLADTAGITASDYVLDAGCGVGGSALFLSQNIGCKTVGISLSTNQIQKANELAEHLHLNELAQFHVRDFTQTGFAADSFDVVWGLESICHAQDKAAFVKEAFRLLKPGGRLIVADGFSPAVNLSPSQRKDMDIWLKGWGCESLETVDAFRGHLVASGFEDISYRNITSHVKPSSKRLYYISLPAILLSKVGEWVGFRTPTQTRNIRSAFYQYTTLKQNIWQYGIFLAYKK